MYQLTMCCIVFIVTTASYTLVAIDCSSSRFACRSGQCIALNKRCDEIFDCIDFSDEDNCSTGNCKYK